MQIDLKEVQRSLHAGFGVLVNGQWFFYELYRMKNLNSPEIDLGFYGSVEQTARKIRYYANDDTDNIRYV